MKPWLISILLVSLGTLEPVQGDHPYKFERRPHEYNMQRTSSRNDPVNIFQRRSGNPMSSSPWENANTNEQQPEASRSQASSRHRGQQQQQQPMQPQQSQQPPQHNNMHQQYPSMSSTTDRYEDFPPYTPSRSSENVTSGSSSAMSSPPRAAPLRARPSAIVGGRNAVRREQPHPLPWMTSTIMSTMTMMKRRRGRYPQHPSPEVLSGMSPMPASVGSSK